MAKKYNRAWLIKVIHTAQRKIGKTNDEMIDIKMGVCGKASCRDMTTSELRDVYDRMKELGFRPVHRSAKKSGMTRPAAPEKRAQLRKIEALLADQNLSWQYADGIARRMYGVACARWCYPDQLQGVITALVKKQRAGSWEQRAKS